MVFVIPEYGSPVEFNVFVEGLQFPGVVVSFGDGAVLSAAA